MNGVPGDPVLLALDAGVRETGWAVFQSNALEETGIIAIPGSRRLDASVRVKHLISCLDELVAQWQPRVVAYSQPSGIRWPVPSLELLESALLDWSEKHHLCVYSYTAQEVRLAVVGHPNAAKEQLAYSVMLELGLIGEGKTTHEWEAVGVGHYHLTRWPGVAAGGEAAGG